MQPGNVKHAERREQSGKVAEINICLSCYTLDQTVTWSWSVREDGGEVLMLGQEEWRDFDARTGRVERF